MREALVAQFIVFALPRSRTAWLAHYLAYAGKVKVAHDMLIECKKPSDFIEPFKTGRLEGTVETGAVEGWEWLRKQLPRAKFITIHRPLDEIKASLKTFGITPLLGELEFRQRKLIELSKQPGVESLCDSDLNISQCRRWIFEYCTEHKWDPQWDAQLAPLNIQVKMSERIAQLQRNTLALRSLRLEMAKLCPGMELFNADD